MSSAIECLARELITAHNSGSDTEFEKALDALAEAVRVTDSRPELRDMLRDLATEQHSEDGVLEIDYDAVVSFEDIPKPLGAYVAAWVWVDMPDEAEDQD